MTEVIRQCFRAPAGVARSADPLPQSGFFLQLVEFKPLEIAVRNDPDQPVAIQDGEVPIAAIAHLTQCVNGGRIGGNGVRITGHHACKRGVSYV